MYLAGGELREKENRPAGLVGEGHLASGLDGAPAGGTELHQRVTVDYVAEDEIPALAAFKAQAQGPVQVVGVPHHLSPDLEGEVTKLDLSLEGGTRQTNEKKYIK